MIRSLVVGILITLILAPLAVFAQEPLTQTYISIGGSLSLDYPDSWVTIQNLSRFGVYLANGEDALGLVYPLAATLPVSGSVGISISILPTDEVVLSSLPGAGAQSEIAINGRAATRLEVRDAQTEGMAIIISLENNLTMAIYAKSLLGEFAQFEPTVLAIAGVARFQEPTDAPQNLLTSLQSPLTETYTLIDETLAFDYPSDWTISTDPFFGSAMLVNSPISFERHLISQGYDSGFVAISVTSNLNVSSFTFNRQDGTRLTIAGRRAIRLVGECPGVLSTEVEAIYFTIDAGNGKGWQIAACALSSELEQVEPMALAIAETMRVPMSGTISPVVTPQSGVDYMIRNITTRPGQNTQITVIEFEVLNNGEAATIPATVALIDTTTGQTLETNIVPPLAAQEVFSVQLPVDFAWFPAGGEQTLRVAVGIGEVEAVGSETIANNFALINIAIPATVQSTPAATPTSANSPIATFTASINVRHGPGTQFTPPIGSFAAGDTTEILAVTPDGGWYKVRFYSAEGWVLAQFVTVSGDISGLPRETGIATPTPTQ